MVSNNEELTQFIAAHLPISYDDAWHFVDGELKGGMFTDQINFTVALSVRDKRIEDLNQVNQRLIKQLNAMNNNWISIKEKLPDTKQRVLVSFTTSSGKYSSITCADYIAPRSVLEEDYMSDDYVGQGDYDDENDCYWTASGFYEWSYESEVNWKLSEEVTHWMPIPESPKSKEEYSCINF